MSILLAFVVVSHVSFSAIAPLPPKSNVRALEQGSGLVKTVECHKGVCKF